MENRPIRILYEGGGGEIVEKKSRFIATIERIETEEDALAFIARMKKQYWDARHNCYAFVAGKNHELQRCSDDGEPNGTAGRPMLDVLLREDIHNLAVVVTRYFGGTLLGTGGLVRAYQKAVQEGLKNSRIVEKCPGIQLTITTDYTGVGKIQYILGQAQIPITDSQYTDKVVITAMCPAGQIRQVTSQLTEATSGKAVLEETPPLYYGIVDGEVILF